MAKINYDDPQIFNADPGDYDPGNPPPYVDPKVTAKVAEGQDPPAPGGVVTAGDLSGAQERFQREYGQSDAGGQGIKAYQDSRASGLGHEDAYQAAIKSMGWLDPGAARSSGGGGGGGGASTAAPSGQPAPSAAPGTPDNSGMNALIAQMLESAKSRDALSAQQYADQQKFRQNTLDTVNGIVSRNSGTATAEDPVIAAQSTAFKGQGEQALRQARESYAARARASGSATGELDSALTGGYDALGKNTGAYTAGLVGSENTARRNNLMGAAQIGAGILGKDEDTALQDKIATLNAGLSASKTQGDQAIDWATLLQKPQLASIAAGPGNSSAGAQWAGVNNQNSQFYDKFTYDQAQNDDMTNLLSQLLLQGA